MSEVKELTQTIQIENKWIKDVLQGVELISGIALDIDIMFDLGILRKRLMEYYEEFEKQQTSRFRNDPNLKTRKHPQTGEDQQYIPLGNSMQEYDKAIRKLNDKPVEVNLPKFKLSMFKPDPKKDKEEDPRHKIPSGFYTRMIHVMENDLRK